MVLIILMICNFVYFLKLLAGEQGEQVGKISRQWSGVFKEMFTDADNFSVNCKHFVNIILKWFKTASNCELKNLDQTNKIYQFVEETAALSNNIFLSSPALSEFLNQTIFLTSRSVTFLLLHDMTLCLQSSLRLKRTRNSWFSLYIFLLSTLV